MFKENTKQINKMKHLILSLILLAASLNAFAQGGQIKGVVRDKLTNQPIPFVNIIVSGTTNGTVTNEEGLFELSNITTEFAQLQLSSLGYSPLMSEVIYLSKIRAIQLTLEMEPTSETLSEVKVSAQPFVRRAESPVSLQNLGIDLIERSAGANRDISKVLQSLPGVGTTSTFRNDLIVRGGGPSENKFYLDGIEIPVLNHFSTQGASGGPVGILNVDFIREVDFYSSAFPATRGNAMSSVFEFKQIDGNKDRTSMKASLGASEVSLSVNTPISQNTTLIASARRSYLQLLFKLIDQPFLPTFNDFSFKTKTRFNDKNELTIIGIGAIDEFKLNPSPNPSEEKAYSLSYLPAYEQWNYATGLSYKHFFKHSYLTLIASRNKLNNTSFKYRDNIETSENLIYDYNSNETENKFRAEISARPYNFTITAGVGAEQAIYDNRTYSQIYTTNGFAEKQYQSDLEVLKWSAFGNVSHPFFNQKLTLSLGIRVDANNYSTAMQNAINQLSPRISASYQIAPMIWINGAVGRYYQLPAYTTMGYRNEAGSLVNKNNDLTYIRSEHLVAGIEFKPNEYTRLSIEGFWKDYDNYPFSVSDSISLASKGNDFGVFGDEEVTSTSTGRSRGFEVLARQRSPRGYTFLLAYTYVNSEFTNYNDQLIPSSWDSKHLLTLTASKSFKNNWNVGAKWRFIGALPYTPYDFDRSSMVEAWDAKGKEYLDYSKFNALRADAYQQLDLRIDKSYLFNGWSLSVYFDIQNAYNFKLKSPLKLTQIKDENGNPVIINPTDERSQQRYALKTLQTTSGTVLPSIGLIVEF